MQKAAVSVSFCECGDHAFAPTNHGVNVLVSLDDAHLLTERWFVTVGPRGYFTVTRTRTLAPRQRKRVILAREILKPSAGRQADHASGDSLDNRRPNLREATPAQNSFNRMRRTSTGFKGVRRNYRKFTASIKAHGKWLYLGNFNTAEEAYAAYCAAARELHGEFARLA